MIKSAKKKLKIYDCSVKISSKDSSDWGWARWEIYQHTRGGSEFYENMTEFEKNNNVDRKKQIILKYFFGCLGRIEIIEPFYQTGSPTMSYFDFDTVKQMFDKFLPDDENAPITPIRCTAYSPIHKRRLQEALFLLPEKERTNFINLRKIFNNEVIPMVETLEKEGDRNIESEM